MNKQLYYFVVQIKHTVRWEDQDHYYFLTSGWAYETFAEFRKFIHVVDQDIISYFKIKEQNEN